MLGEAARVWLAGVQFEHKGKAVLLEIVRRRMVHQVLVIVAKDEQVVLERNPNAKMLNKSIATNVQQKTVERSRSGIEDIESRHRNASDTERKYMSVHMFYLTLQIMEPDDLKRNEIIEKLIAETLEHDQTTQEENGGMKMSAKWNNQMTDDNKRGGVGRNDGNSVLCDGDENGRIELVLDREGNRALIM